MNASILAVSGYVAIPSTYRAFQSLITPLPVTLLVSGVHVASEGDFGSLLS
jgi:hypothetical protein